MITVYVMNETRADLDQLVTEYQEAYRADKNADLAELRNTIIALSYEAASTAAKFAAADHKGHLSEDDRNELVSQAHEKYVRLAHELIVSFNPEKQKNSNGYFIWVTQAKSFRNYLKWLPFGVEEDTGLTRTRGAVNPNLDVVDARVLANVHTVAGEFEAVHGRQWTDDERFTFTYEYCLNKQVDDYALTYPELTDDERREKAVVRLRKSGFTRRLKNIAELLGKESINKPGSIYAPYGDNATLVDVLADTPADTRTDIADLDAMTLASVLGLTAKDKKVVLAHLDDPDTNPAPRSALQGEMSANMFSPVNQFVSFIGVEGQFVEQSAPRTKRTSDERELLTAAVALS